ncbi:hypothetical protein EGT50_01660 [Rhodococcus xishaensis]|uniref:Uncharacterized protein n=1 Tax=Rhodococcus xishaensis TaxID=2487364 RepID=A0A438B2Z9_9NOCA|nr:hypothetical protein EGT50_01660 [Rhodococcus xishaensis]
MTLREVAVRFFVEWIGTGLESDSRSDERRELIVRHPHPFAAEFRPRAETEDLFSSGLHEIDRK